jgi:two-component system OmpR family sensor kinase
VSLRARLLVAMLLLVTAGLLAADLATYRFLSSFLTERVDDQLTAAILPAVRALSVPESAPPDQQGPGGGSLFPAGTYAAVLDEDGSVVREHVFAFGQTVPPAPALPAGLPGSTGAGGATAARTFSTPATSGDTSYRVQARPLVGGGTLVVAIPLTEVSDTLHRLVLIEGAVTLAVLAAVGGLTWWLMRLGLRPLERMGNTAGAIAAGDLSRRVEPTDPNTEIGRLGLALNAMLARIEEAFAERRASADRLRRFVADASHELRTPLTSVQGYAELFRRGASENPEDLRTAMRRIEEESARMSELVDELSLLARLDQDRPLDREPVDLAAVAKASVDGAQVADPTRPIDLDAGDPVVVRGDAGRLRQIADNLLSNSRLHTPPGTPIHVRVLEDVPDAVLEVEDEGPGVAPEDAERIFERFYRADPSRSRASGGAGLGLSIVAAVAEAHGGRASYRPSSDGGAHFEVRMPRGDTPD